jgi:hypothetical protein
MISLQIVRFVLAVVGFLAIVAITVFRYQRKNKQRRLGVLGNIHLNDKHVTVLPTASQPEQQIVIGTQFQSGAYDASAFQSPHVHGHAPLACLPPSYQHGHILSSKHSPNCDYRITHAIGCVLFILSSLHC